MILTRRRALALAALGAGGVAAQAAAGRAGGMAPAPVLRLEPDSQLTQGGWARGTVLPGWSPRLDGKPVEADAAGRFFIAFDRDAGASALLEAWPAAGQGNLPRPFPLAIAPRHWDVEAVDAPFHPPEIPDEAFLKIRKAEVAEIAVARAHDTGAQGWRQGFHWPVDWRAMGGRISGLFGAQRIYRGTPGAYHSGLDIAVPAGTPYAAPADGTVVLAADHPFTLEGNLLLLDHGMGLSSAFLHAQALLVKPGDAVTQGQRLGLVGMTGRATGPHLHWGMMWQGRRLDPLLFVGPTG